MKSISLQSVFVIVLIFLMNKSSTVSLYKWQKEKIPNPFRDPPMYCRIENLGHSLCDPEGQLNSTSSAYIIKKLSEFTRLIKCPCSQGCKEGQSGLAIGFVIINEYESDSESTEVNPPVLQKFAHYIRRAWNFGSCDNSVLIIIATEQKQYGISIGSRANQVINDTWYMAIMEENFRDRSDSIYISTRINNILFMLKEAIIDEIKRNENKTESLISSLSDSNNNSIWYTCSILLILLLIIPVISIILFIVLRHRKENDDVSLRDVWSKKFWMKAGNQYKEAKQSESNNEKNIEKNDEEEVKVKLASSEDLKAADENIEYPGKLSKV